jgi:hypothetical protein
MTRASFDGAIDEFHSIRRARRQFDLEVCWTTNTQSEHGCGRMSNVRGIPDTTGGVFYVRLDVLAISIFLLVDVQSGKCHRNREEHGVYGEEHTRTDPPTITKRICEWIAELLCLFVLCRLHEAVGIESKGVGI